LFSGFNIKFQNQGCGSFKPGMVAVDDVSEPEKFVTDAHPNTLPRVINQI
jgi:hypothetical protein